MTRLLEGTRDGTEAGTMAGEWIKLRHDLDDDPHVLRAQELLDVGDIDLLIGKLRRLWMYGDRHTVHGFIRFGTPAMIDRIVRLDGFGEALAQVGWLEFTGAGCQIPRFDEHNSESAKKRALTARRMSRLRKQRHGGDAPASRNGNSGVTQASRSGNKRAPREEKRREEKEEMSGDVSPKPPLSPPDAAEGVAPAPMAADAPPKKSRRRDELFDAVQEVTGADPRASGSHIGKVCASLRAAEPPYTPGEVRRLPPILSARGFTLPLTIATVEKYIGWTRRQPAPAAPKGGTVDGRTPHRFYEQGDPGPDQAGHGGTAAGG